MERFDGGQGVADAPRPARHTLPGRSRMLFGEGACQRMPGLRPDHLGAFQAAVEAGVPVVPITIRGTRTVLRPDTWLPRRGNITVVIDPPIEPNPQGERTDSGAWAEAWSRNAPFKFCYTGIVCQVDHADPFDHRCATSRS